MCGRVNLHNSRIVQAIMESVGISLQLTHGEPRYNICPTQRLEVITQNGEIETQEWAIEFGNFRHPNTKVSTLMRRKDLQTLLLENRCVVPLNRFYEWPDPKVRPIFKDIKTRFCISNPEDAIFLAGISKTKRDTRQFNILTTEPNRIINTFHHRMPVWLKADEVRPYLTATTLQDIGKYFEPYSGEMNLYECDPYVNNARHEGPQCMRQIRTWEEFRKQALNL